MARPQKNTVDYFPHNVKHGKKMSYIEKKYGNDGYAVWFKILEELGDANNHFLNLSDEVQLMFLSERCNVSEDVLLSIIDDLVKLKEFDKYLWNDKIIWSEKFTDSIKDAYLKRNNKCMDYPSLLQHLQGLGVLKQGLLPLKGNGNTQTKLKETKEDKTKLFYDNENDFLNDWKTVREKHTGKPTNIKKLNFKEQQDFNGLVPEFSIENFRNAMIGLFRQKDMFESNQLRPTHFLSDRNIEKYLDVFNNKTQLFKKEKPMI